MGQAAHDEDWLGAKNPALHATHVAADVAVRFGLALPAAHGVHSRAPSCEYVPAGQAAHVKVVRSG